MAEKSYDVVGIGNAIVDIIARCDEGFLTKHDLVKGSRPHAVCQRRVGGGESGRGSVGVVKQSRRIHGDSRALAASFVDEEGRRHRDVQRLDRRRDRQRDESIRARPRLR